MIAIARTRSIAAGLLIACAVTAVAQEPAPPPPQGPLSEARVEFVVANAVFALLHEFGHVIINDYEVPLLGLEEDSADTLAAMMMLPGGKIAKKAENRERLARMLALSAVGNAMTWKGGVEKGSNEILYWDSHGLSARRAARIACLIYGSDEQRYAWVAETAKMPDFRRDGCADEYATARRASDWVVATFGNARGRDDRKGDVTVAFGMTANAGQAAIRRFLQERNIVTGIADAVDAQFEFKAPLTVRVRICGGPNAYWDRDARELILCYELLDGFVQQSADPAVGKAYENITRAVNASPGAAPQGAQ